MIGADGDADRGQDPDAGGGGDAYNNAIPREDHARSQKADACDDLTDDAQIQDRLLIDTAERCEGINANTNQDTRADADGLAGYLSLKADDRPSDHCTNDFRPAKR